MKNLLQPEYFEKTINRIRKIDAFSKPKWGKMNAAQMVYHCQKPLIIALGKDDYGLKRNIFAQWFFKRQLYNNRKWPQGMATPAAFKVTESKDFDVEHKELINLLQEFFAQRESKSWPKHPVFGNFTPEQVGKMQYKHLDHHLTQFGV